MNLVQIQSRVQELPNSAQTMQYLNAAMNGQVTTVPPYIAAAELKRRETEGMMDQLAKGAAQASASTVKDQLQQKMGIMALMGQRQPPQPPQIPQPAPPEQQPQAGGIDSLPVKEDMFGMAGGGIVGFSGDKPVGSVVPPAYESPYDRMNRQNREAAAQRGSGKPLDAEAQAALQEAQRTGDRNAMLTTIKKLGAAGYDLATIIPRAFMGVAEDIANTRLGRALGIDFKLPQAAYGGDRASLTPMMDRVNRTEEAGVAAQQPAPAVPASTGEASMAGQDAINAALKAAGASTSNLPAMTQGQRAATAVKPAAAAKPPPVVKPPPTDGGINLADLAPGASPTAQVDAVEMSPSYQRMLKLAAAANPYAGKQETQQEYIDRRNQGILSQIPGGKKPYETSEARLKEIEARRAKEDTDYAESNKGRQLDNLLTFISGMGRGSFGNAGAQGIEAVQKVERSQREEDLRRKDLRDQQSMKLMEIRTLNDQAQYAEATGNITEFERLQREIKKLENEYTFKQAELDKELTTIGATARGRDTESADKARQLKEESRQKQLEREKDIQVERIRVAGQASARASGADDKTVKMAEDAFTRDPEAQAIKKRLESSVNPAKRQTDLDRLREIQAAKYRQFGITLEGAPSPAPAAGGNRPPLSSFQR
jgi:hypothetical protein